MSTDRARRSFDATRMYRSVVAQQGRVTVEADSNEAEDIRSEASRAELLDTIGASGSPDAGFQISVPAPGAAPFDFAIAAGTLYVGGARLHTEATTYAGQRATEWKDHPPGLAPGEPADSAPTPFHELIYLSVHEQEVSAVEDSALREVA